MCKWGTLVEMELLIPARLSHTGIAYRKTVQIDLCIAPLVKALNDAGIVTDASCCGHGKLYGSILLADSRCLEIYPDQEAWHRDAPSANSPVTIHGEPLAEGDSG